MARLEELKSKRIARGIRLGESVEIIDTKWHGPDVIELTFRTQAGKPIQSCSSEIESRTS